MNVCHQKFLDLRLGNNYYSHEFSVTHATLALSNFEMWLDYACDLD